MPKPCQGIDPMSHLHGRWLWGPLAAMTLALAGCSHVGNDMLEITPRVFSECSGPNIAVRVEWNATSVVGDDGVRLFVYKPGRQPTLWMQAASKGEGQTGRWASDGWTVTLVDNHGRLLATRTLQTTACPQQQVSSSPVIGNPR